MSKFNVLVPEKISEYAPDMKHFQSATLFSGSKRQTFLYLVNIPIQNCIPHQNFIDPLLADNNAGSLNFTEAFLTINEFLCPRISLIVATSKIETTKMRSSLG